MSQFNSTLNNISTHSHKLLRLTFPDLQLIGLWINDVLTLSPDYKKEYLYLYELLNKSIRIDGKKRYNVIVTLKTFNDLMNMCELLNMKETDNEHEKLLYDFLISVKNNEDKKFKFPDELKNEPKSTNPNK